jgi:1,4-alpha-glucan branching enzyme
MGAIPHAGGVAFCVWAPNAQRVAVIGMSDGLTVPFALAAGLAAAAFTIARMIG